LRSRPVRASKGRILRSCSQLDHRPSRSLPGSRRPCSNRTIVMLLIQCAWMNRHDQVVLPFVIHGRKTRRVSRGALSRCVSWA